MPSSWAAEEAPPDLTKLADDDKRSRGGGVGGFASDEESYWGHITELALSTNISFLAFGVRIKED